MLAGGDDRCERDALRAAPAHRHLEVERDLALRAPDEAADEHLLERVVGELRGGAERVDLGRVLDRAQALDERAGRDELDPLGRELREPRVLLDGEVRVVEAQAQRAVAGQALDRALEQVGRDLALPELVELVGRLREVAKVGDEAPLVGPDERGGVRAREARQPADVDDVRHEQHVELALLGGGQQGVEARVHPPSSVLRVASASR